MHYATATMQVPKYAQPGQEGQELWVTLELKVIADVGLIGFPNVENLPCFPESAMPVPRLPIIILQPCIPIWEWWIWTDTAAS